MNIRVILLIMVVVLFAAGCGAMSFLSGGGTTLEQAYDNKQVEIVQSTSAGAIPHNVTINNNGTKPVMVDKGTILKSKESQDLVIIDDKKVNPNSNDTVQAYCIEPDQKAVPGSTLYPAGTVSNQVKQIIDTSNPSDLQNATQSQMQIWIIASKGNVDVYSGESMAVVQTQKTKYYLLKEKLDTAKTDVMSRFNLTSDAIGNISLTADSDNSANTWISDIRQWFKNTLGI
ncbi:MAG: ARPP-1 family domain-containing protein [Methanobacterium formicicum]